jgi:hypothetical protein
LGKHDRKEDDDGEAPEEPSGEDPPKGRTTATLTSVGSKIAVGVAVEAVKRWVLPLLPW